MVTMRSVVGNVAGEHIQQRRFAGAGSARDQNVQPPLDHGREQFEHRLGEGLVLDHLAGGDGIASETADGEARAVDGQRRNDGVDAGSVGQAGVHHRRRFIDPASDARDDALDDLHQVRVVFERQPGQFEFAGAFDVDPVEAVDQNVGDGGIFEQRLERAEAEDFVENFARQPLAFGEAERNGFAVDRSCG